MATSQSKAATIRVGDSLFARQRESFRELAWRLDTQVGLLSMFAIAFLIRLAIAPWVGFYFDLHNAQIWAASVPTGTEPASVQIGGYSTPAEGQPSR